MDTFDLKKYLAEGRLFENKIQDYKDFNFVAVVKFHQRNSMAPDTNSRSP